MDSHTVRLNYSETNGARVWLENYNLLTEPNKSFICDIGLKMNSKSWEGCDVKTYNFATLHLSYENKSAVNVWLLTLLGCRNSL